MANYSLKLEKNPALSKSCSYVVALLVFFGLLALPAVSFAESGKEWRSKSAQGYFHSSPSGARIGSVYPNAKLKEVSRKGTWVKVELQAWFPESSLRSAGAKGAGKKKAAVKAPGALPIVLSGFEVERRGEYSGEGKKAVLKLSLKNEGKESISSWEGLLIVKDKAKNKVLFRYPVAGDTRAIAPGKSETFLFGWESSSEEYHQILSYPDPNSALSVKVVKLKKPR